MGYSGTMILVCGGHMVALTLLLRTPSGSIDGPPHQFPWTRVKFDFNTLMMEVNLTTEKVSARL